MPPELQETGAPAQTVGDRPDRENRDDPPSRRRLLSDSRSDSPKDRFHDAITPGRVKRKGLGGHDTCTLLEIFPQQRPRAVKSGLDSFRSDIQTRNGLRHCKAFDSSEDDD
jgi:hypothetical protein